MEIAEEIVGETEEIQGLCVTCNHLEDCRHRLQDGLVIWYCEEYDDYVPPEPQAFSHSTNIIPFQKVSDKVNGLCVNCEHLKDCIHAKKTGGVWYCEEYE